MKTIKNVPNLLNNSSYRMMAIAMLLVMLMSALPIKRVSASGTISGTVYIDYNMNGTMDTSGASPNYAIDKGMSGVTVTAYDSSGTQRGTAVSGSNGTYSFATTGTGPYRVEFTSLPSGYYPSSVGTQNDSAIQFVNEGGSGNVDFGILSGKDYCQNNPRVIVNCYVRGDNDGHVIVHFPYNYVDEMDGKIDGTWTSAPSRTSSLDPTSIADNNQVGTTFGMAWHRDTKNLYSAAFLKSGAKFGALSGESTGAIYVNIDPTASTPSAPTLYVDLNAVFGAGTAGVNPHPAASTNWTDHDATVVANVHKRSLGGMELSADGSTLYVVNLNNRRLYSIPTSGALNSTTITSVAIPTANLPTTSTTGICPTGDVRPFGLGRHENGTIYVGAVCSAESTDDNADLHAYVWSFDGTNFTLVANNTLNYAREISMTIGNDPQDWHYWDNADSDISRPAPALTDIDFDGDVMLLGIQDRYGNQVFNPNFFRGYGDILRACPSGGGIWTFESNGTCGGSAGGGVGSSGGYNGGEYYLDLNGDNRQEGGLGGVFQIPGYDHLMITAYDAVAFNSAGTRTSNFYTGGVQKYNNTTGLMTGAYDVYLEATPDTFGKPNGLGDVDALCNAAPLQVGNRIWVDTNLNGVQDPGEAPIQNVAVELWADTNNDNNPDTMVGTATTDSDGNYIFGGNNNTNLLTYSCGSPTSGTVDVRVNSNSDDAEQATSGGSVSLTSTDLDFFGDNNGGGTAQSNLGVRFNNLNIPQGATITSASVEFTANNGSSVSAGNPTITIQGEDTDNAGTFETTANNISGRTWLSGQDVTWNPGAWSNASTTNASTPSLTNIVQAIVNRTGWASGNSMAFRFTGTSTTSSYREAESFDGSSARAPRLVVNYTYTPTCTREVNPNTAYEVRIPSSNFGASGALFGYSATAANNDSSTNGDSRDSDGVPSGGNIITTFTTGSNSQNNHSYDFGFRLSPTAAGASVGGAVKTSRGRAISRAQVSILNLDSLERQTTRTNPFGYFNFDDLQVGDSYVLTVQHKSYMFTNNEYSFTLQDDLTNITFVADVNQSLPSRNKKEINLLNQRLMKGVIDRKP